MNVLYVCTGNSFRSPVAEALTRRYQPELEAKSAGTEAVNHIASNAKELLAREDCLKFVKPMPDQISQQAIDEADLVVAMTQRHESYISKNFEINPANMVVWGIKDPINPGISAEEAFELILGHVKNL
ncbi:MAG: hypothetical protein U5K69_16905 [Balneolaceae bacterium]|nr:hypothetical protein [Balneolaceae bacterium]